MTRGPVNQFNLDLAASGLEFWLRPWRGPLWILSATPVVDDEFPTAEHGTLLVFGPADEDTAVEQAQLALQRALAHNEGLEAGTVIAGPWARQ